MLLLPLHLEWGSGAGRIAMVAPIRLHLDACRPEMDIQRYIFTMQISAPAKPSDFSWPIDVHFL
jgi:hypothetical protein